MNAPGVEWSTGQLHFKQYSGHFCYTLPTPKKLAREETSTF